MHAAPPDGHDAADHDCVFTRERDPERRAFLRGAGAALGALAILGLDAEAAMAIPVRLARGTRGARGTVRYPVPAGDSVTFDEANALILVRRGANVWAFVATCPHKEVVKLRWMKGDDRFQCPKHESKYQPDGAFIEGKATRNMDRLPIRKEGAELVVDPDTVIPSDSHAAAWAAAVVTV
ncbi:MAG: Rieske (2Fe-2S) protein [Gemmatimonadetes bacterium]|nr:Rieske (2Fe-2S) protein [Gemmatimonadota bacterium]